MSKSFGVLAVCATILLLGGPPVEAATDDKGANEQKVAEIRRPETTQQKLRTRLVSLGLTVDEADTRIAALTAADLQKLEKNFDQVRMAGVKDSTLILIAVILILPGLIVLMAI
jgi:hypothetical protein